MEEQEQPQQTQKKSNLWVWIIIVVILIAIGIYLFLNGNDGGTSGTALNNANSASNSIPQPPALPSD